MFKPSINFDNIHESSFSKNLVKYINQLYMLFNLTELQKSDTNSYVYLNIFYSIKEICTNYIYTEGSKYSSKCEGPAVSN